MATRDDVMAQIAALLQSGNVPVAPAPQPSHQFVAPEMRDLGTNIPFETVFGSTQRPKVAAPKAGGGLPLWQQALLQLDRPRAAVSNILDELTDGERSSLGSVAGRGWAGLANKEHSSITDTFNNIGWKQVAEDPTKQSYLQYLGARLNNSSRDIAEFFGDALIDPTTYVTLGAGSTIKAGASAGAKASAKEAARLGVKASKNLHTAPQEYAKQIAKSLTDKGVAPDLAERFATKKTAGVSTNIQNAVKGAQNKAQNAAINFDLPFTNVTKQFGSKPGFLKKTEQEIGSSGAVAASDIARQLGKTDDEIAAFYEVPGLDKLNTQQFAHLREQADSFSSMHNAGAATKFANDGTLKNNLRDFTLKDEPIGSFEQVTYKPFNADEFLSNLTSQLGGDARIASRIEPFIKGFESDVDKLRKIAPESLTAFGSALEKLPGTIKGKTAKSIQESLQKASELATKADNTATIKTVPIIGQVLREVEKHVDPKSFTKSFEAKPFVQGAGGRSKVGNTLGKVGDKFNARTIGSSEGLVNKSADKLKDTENAIYAKSQQVKQEVDALAKEGEGLTKAQKEAIPHIVEGKFPDGFNKADVTPEMKSIAGKMASIFKRIGDEEFASGALESLRKGYFPHVLSGKVSADKIARLRTTYKDDKAFTELLGKASTSQFSKERKSFETLAEVDNAMAKLEHASGKPNLTEDQKAEIAEKIDVLKNLFERDPFNALAKRYAKSVKTTAMKNLYDDLSKDGLIMSSEKFTSNPAAIRTEKYVQLEDAQAKALGLEKGSYVNKELIDSLKRVDGIFTNEGINKLMGNIESVQNMWKTLVTSVPSHYWNNFVGNIFNNTLAGVGGKSYLKASKILKDAKAGKLSKEDDALLSDALSKGVLHQNYMSDFIRSDESLQGGKLAKWEKKFRDNKITSAMRKKGGQPVENFTRLALFVHGLEKTGSSKQASDMVRKYLFNYNELTSADRAVRVMVPFWNWMKNNIPLQIEKLAQNPRLYKQYVQLKEDSQEDKELPDFAKESYFGVGGDKAYNPNLPLNDLNGVLGNSPVDPLRTLLSGLNPIFKNPAEIVSNKSMFTGRPIDYEREYRGGFDPQAWAKYALSQGGKIGNTAYDATSGESSVLEALAKLFNPFGSTMDIEQKKGG